MVFPGLASIEDGKVVPTPDVVYTHEFYYRPEDIPASPPEADTTPE